MTSIEAIDKELDRLHKELATFQDCGDAYGGVLDAITRLNSTLANLAQREAVFRESLILKCSTKPETPENGLDNNSPSNGQMV